MYKPRSLINALTSVSIFLGTALLVFGATACTAKSSRNTLQRFVQDGSRTLFRLTDKAGATWTVGFVQSPSASTYFVVDSGGQVRMIAAAFDEQTRAAQSVIFVDSTRKEDALAVLDRKFLSGVADKSHPYEEWLNRHANFTYGTLQHTQRIDMEGPLATSNIRIEGNSVIGRMKDVKCHCTDFVPICAGLPSPHIA